MTLISAPVGYGKSTLAGLWLDSSETPGCWVSLDEEDDHLHTFLAYLVAAIHSIAHGALIRTQFLLEASVLPSPTVVAGTLLNDLEGIPHRLLLVLDDLHEIRSQPVFEFLTGLLRHPSPKLHLVLISRRDPPMPLPLLRARNQINEIRARDLRFSRAETASLLAGALNRVIDDAVAEAWTKQTEGWVTALSLAASELRRRDEGDPYPDDGSVGSRHLQDYLQAEIMNRLDPTLREWLLSVAWLDRFCPALCTAICGPDAALAQAELTGETFIQQLQDNNLFIISLDRSQHWFRLHHLFRDLLQMWGRTHYDVDEIAAIHRRAGTWFADRDLPGEAIRHLVLGGDCVAAEKVMQKHRYATMNAEHWPALERWLRYFPHDFVASSAMLMNTVALIAMDRGKYKEMVSAWRQAAQLLAGQAPESVGNDALAGELSTITAILAVADGRSETLDANAQRALQLLPADALLMRSLAYGAAAAGLQMRGRFADGCRLLEETMNLPEWPARIQVQFMLYLYLISFMNGDLSRAQAWAEHVLRLADEHNLLGPLCTARQMLGVVHFLRNDFAAAEPLLSTLFDNYATSAQSHVCMGGFALALIYDTQGDSTRADAVIDRLDTYLQNTENPSMAALIEAFAVELALRRGKMDEAKRKRIGIDFNSRPPLWFFHIPQLTPIKLLLAEGTPEALGDAHSALSEFEDRMQRMNRNLARIDGLTLLALVCEAQGDTGRADTTVMTALRLAQNGGIIRPFVDLGPPMAALLKRQCDGDGADREGADAFVMQILAAFPTAASALIDRPSLAVHQDQDRSETTPPAEPLTERERQVLQQLAARLTPNEIAARHVVSVATVRSQIKSIYRKLDVHSRKEAVRRALELNIVA